MQFTKKSPLNVSCSQNLSIKSAPKQAQMNANTFASGPSTTNTYLLMPPTLGITAISEHDAVVRKTPLDGQMSRCQVDEQPLSSTASASAMRIPSSLRY